MGFGDVAISVAAAVILCMPVLLLWFLVNSMERFFARRKWKRRERYWQELSCHWLSRPDDLDRIEQVSRFVEKYPEYAKQALRLANGQLNPLVECASLQQFINEMEAIERRSWTERWGVVVESSEC